MAPKFYRRRWFEMDPELPATITIQAEGGWEMTGPGGVYHGTKGRYTLRFTPASATSLSYLEIDPDPGGGTAE
jgi:hypothetical protein